MYRVGHPGERLCVSVCECTRVCAFVFDTICGVYTSLDERETARVGGTTRLKIAAIRDKFEFAYSIMFGDNFRIAFE